MKRALSIHSLPLAASIVAALVAACGAEQPRPPSSPPATPAPLTTPSSEPAVPANWDALSFNQKRSYMKSAVMPKMGSLFHNYDPARFAEVTCGTCHGTGAKNGLFKMPNPDLPKLSVEGEFRKHREKDAKIVDFMMRDVEVQMAGLLGEHPYDPKTQAGFGCFNCHVKSE